LMPTSDEEFLRSLKVSHEVTVQVAAWLRSKGRDAHVQTTRIRPSHSEWKDYIDDGDIFIEGKGRIEVKYRENLSFVCTETYKYPTIFVDEVRKVDMEHAAPLVAYIIVNKERTHVAIIKPDSKQFWIKSKRFDRRTSDDREFYECPKILAAFRCMRRT